MPKKSTSAIIAIIAAIIIVAGLVVLGIATGQLRVIEQRSTQ